MSGDSLAVFLFLVGSAVTCGVAAVTVDGIRRNVLIAITAVLGVLAAITAIGGLSVFGGAAAALLENARSPVSWFVLLVFLLALIVWGGRGSSRTATVGRATLKVQAAPKQVAPTTKAAKPPAFTAPVDVENKLKAIDDILTFYREQVLGFAKSESARRTAIQHELDIKALHAMKEDFLELYRGLHGLRDKYRHYPALTRLLSDPPSKEPYFEFINLTEQAFQSASQPNGITHHHSNQLFGWFEEWRAWWRSVDAQLLEMRKSLAGG